MKNLGFSGKVALSSALIIQLLPTIHSNTIIKYPQFLCLAFVLISMLGIIYFASKNKMSAVCITIISTASLLFFHPVTTLFLIIVLIGFFAFNLISKKIPDLKKNSLKSSSLQITIVIFITYVIFYANVFLSSIIYHMQHYPKALLISEQSNVSYLSGAQIIFAYLPYFILIFLGIIGSLASIQYNNKLTPFLASLFAVSAVAIAGIMITPGLGISRFLVFLELFISFPAAVGLILIANGTKSNAKKIVLFFIVYLFAFSSVVSYLSYNGDTIMKTEVPVPIQYITEGDFCTSEFMFYSAIDLAIENDSIPILMEPTIYISYELGRCSREKFNKINENIGGLLYGSGVFNIDPKYRYYVENELNNKAAHRNVLIEMFHAHRIYSNAVDNIYVGLGI
jgi:hypothetical protein